MDTQRRTLLAILLCVLIWFAFDWMNPRPPVAPPEPGADGKVAVETKDAEPDAKKSAGADVKEDGATERVDEREDDGDADALAPADPAKRVTGRLENDVVALDVTNLGGLLDRVEMRREQFADAEGKGLDLLGNEKPTLNIGFDRGDGEDEGTDFRFSRNTPWEVVETDNPREWSLRQRTDEVDLAATVTLGDAYEGMLRIKVTNRSAKPQKHRLTLRTQYAQPGEQSRYNIHRGLCATADDVEDFSVDDVDEGAQLVKGSIRWLGLDSKYFLAALVPAEPASVCELKTNEDQDTLFGRLKYRTVTLEPSETRSYEVGLYFGTKEIERLEGYSTIEGAHLEGSIDWGWFGALNRTIGKLMLRLLRWFFSLTGIWGVSILLLTVVVKLATLPLTLKQMNSMKRMKEIQPEIEALREKYKDDRTKQGQEMQALFQRSGVNPLAGCLPLFIQMPIWIALYAMLGTVVELYREPFLWLPDLTQPDPFFILPVAMGGLMFLQTRLQPAMDSQQAKMMGIMMPVIFTVMMLFLPSGLGVYIFANVVLSLIQTVIQVRPNKKAAANS